LRTVSRWSAARDSGGAVTLRLQQIAVDELMLDPQNPRLPEELQGAPQPDLLLYLHENGVLDELVQSFVDNSFFEHEPLIAVREHNAAVVLEGNRRLAALKILLGASEAVDQDLRPRLEDPLSHVKLRDLTDVPVYIVADRDEVHKYLGFRHIGGIKTWSAEAKARYLMLESDRAARGGVDNPFLEVARRVGSNSQGVRNAYTALTVLRHASSEYSIQVDEVLRRRFGVWSRCMTAADVRKYIGLDGARSYAEVRDDIRHLPEGPLREVVGDLSSRGDRPPLIRDSRDVTVYGQVLRNAVAHEVLREHQSLDVARQVVELAELPDRIEDLRQRIDVARSEAERAEYSEPLEAASDSLLRAARSLRSTIRALGEDDEE